MRDHIISERNARRNGIFQHCMYCSNELARDPESWTVERNWFSNYVITECSHCKKEHRFSDPNIHTIEDLVEKLR